MTSAIKIENFYYAYRKQELVLHNINLEIEQGSFTVIAGPSGAGKTTLCKAMTGIVPFYMGGGYSGEVEVLGESTKGKRVSDIAMRVGLMLEDYESQLVSLTAGEEVAFSLLNHGFAPSEAAARTAQALEDVGLGGRESYQLDELSGGQRQRLLLAATLAVHPEIIVLDEPVSAMDPSGAHALYELLGKLHKQYQNTIVVVEHHLDFLLPFATDLIVVDGGRIVAADKLENAARAVYRQHPALRGLLPALWQVKLELEERYDLQLAAWRCEEEAIAELKALGFVGGAVC